MNKEVSCSERSREETSRGPGGSWSHGEKATSRSHSFRWTALLLTGSTEATPSVFCQGCPWPHPNGSQSARVSKWYVPWGISLLNTEEVRDGPRMNEGKWRNGSKVFGFHFILSFETCFHPKDAGIPSSQ